MPHADIPARSGGVGALSFGVVVVDSFAGATVVVVVVVVVDAVEGPSEGLGGNVVELVAVVVVVVVVEDVTISCPAPNNLHTAGSM